MKYTDLRTALLAWKGDRSEIEAAAALGVAPNTLGNWTDGTHTPTATRVPALAVALGMPVDDLRALVARDRRARSKGLARIVRSGSRRSHASQSTVRGGK